MPLSSCREVRFGRQAAPRLRCRRLSACWTRTDSACAGPSFSYACWRILLCPQIAAWDFSSFSFRCSPLFDRQCSPAGPSAEHRSPGPVRVQPFAQQAVACCSRGATVCNPPLSLRADGHCVGLPGVSVVLAGGTAGLPFPPTEGAVAGGTDCVPTGGSTAFGEDGGVAWF